MTEAEERFMQWLRDAHAMEKQAEQMLAGLAGRIESYPQVKSKIEEHLQQTKEQARRLDRCIERRGGDTSTFKDLLGQFVAVGQSFTGMFAGDEVIKGSLASYTLEHMEIASYRILIAAAEELGDRETASVCSEILREEEAMAAWLADNIGLLTGEYLRREMLEIAEAKR
jgi:ferritin-like metal-binding protein YciE